MYNQGMDESMSRHPQVKKLLMGDAQQNSKHSISERFCIKKNKIGSPLSFCVLNISIVSRVTTLSFVDPNMLQVLGIVNSRYT
jgi:hypothetical protein